MTNHKRTAWDPETKTIYLEAIMEQKGGGRKVWDVDPHKQMIALLIEQCELLKRILAQTAPYHTGPQTVTVEKPPGIEIGKINMDESSTEEHVTEPATPALPDVQTEEGSQSDPV